MVCRAARRRRGPQALQRELPQVGSARPSFQSLVELIRWPGAVGGRALLNPVPRSAGGGMGAHLRQRTRSRVRGGLDWPGCPAAGWPPPVVTQCVTE